MVRVHARPPIFSEINHSAEKGTSSACPTFPLSPPTKLWWGAPHFANPLPTSSTHLFVMPLSRKNKGDPLVFTVYRLSFKAFKRLLKKFPSLDEDLEVAKQYYIKLFHYQKIDKHGIFKIGSVGNNDDIQLFKIKKFACKALKGRGSKSGIRVIYAFYCQNCKVDFIEIYFKGEKKNEDRKRIQAYLKNFS